MEKTNVNLTKQIEDIKSALKADKAKFEEAKSKSINEVKTKIDSLTKANNEALSKLDAKHADAVKSSADKLEKENGKKVAKLEKLKNDYNKALEFPKSIIQEYKNFQNDADRNDTERYSKITAAHKAENKKAISDINKHETNLKNAFEKDTKEFNEAISSLDRKYAEDQKEQTSENNKLLSSIKSAFTKAQNAAENNTQKLTEEYDAKKADLNSKIETAGTNKTLANPLKKELVALTKTYNANVSEVKAKLASDKVLFEKETSATNQANDKAMEALRVNYINDKTKLEKEIKEKELRLETDLLNSGLKLGTIEANTELALLSDENRLQVLMNKLTFEMQEAKILGNHADVIAEFELNNAIVELDNEIPEIEAKFLLAKSELEIELKKKQESTKLALEIQKLEYAQEYKVLDDKLELDLKEAKMNFELAQKSNESQENTSNQGSEFKSLAKNYDEAKSKIQQDNKKHLAELNSKNTLTNNKINNELAAFEKEIKAKIAQAEKNKLKELKENQNKRTAAKITHDKTLAKAETEKFETYPKFKILVDQMQSAQNAFSNEILAMTAKASKIRNFQNSETAKNEATFLKKIKENAATFEKKRKSLIANKKA